MRRILTLCAVHVECILYTRPCEHYIATLQYHYNNMVECELLNDDYMRLFMSGSALQQHIHMNQRGEAHFEKVRMSGWRDGPSFS